VRWRSCHRLVAYNDHIFMQYTRTDNLPRTGSTRPGRHCPGFETTLPPEALEELRGRKPRTRLQSAQTKSSCPSRLRSVLLAGALAAPPIFVLAVVAVITWATGSSPSTRQFSTPELERTFHPMAQTPLPALAPPAPAAAQPNQPVYGEWVPQAGGWILANAQCVPLRRSFIADPAPRALPAVPRAELVSMPERRATLVRN
jgi:hypothetical protein